MKMINAIVFLISSAILHLFYKRPRDNAVCLQYEIEVRSPIDQDVIECIFGSDVAPGGYAWIVPIGEEMLRVGLGIRRSRRSPKHYLEKLLKERFQGYRIIRKMAGIVSVGGPMTPSYTDGYMAVGAVSYTHLTLPTN